MKIFELEIDKLFYNDFFTEITENLLNKERFLSSQEGQNKKRGMAIFTPNPEICLKTLEDKEFLEALQKADFLTSDGIGLYIAYQIADLKKKTPIFPLQIVLSFLFLPYFFFNLFFRRKMLYAKYGQRICGSDLTADLLSFAVKYEREIVILDPYFPQDAGKCAIQKVFVFLLQDRFPSLKFGYHILRAENKEEILQTIQKSEARICFATLGMKKQEEICLEVLERCPNIQLALGVGSSFDYYTGFQKRAPKIWRDAGFEWLYRIFTSPNKLKRLGRIYQAVIIFPIRVIFYK